MVNCCGWNNSAVPVGRHFTHVCELDSQTSIIFHWNGEKWNGMVQFRAANNSSSPAPARPTSAITSALCRFFLPLFCQLFLHSVSPHPIWMHGQCAVWSPFLEEMSRAVLWRKVTSVRGGCSADEKVAVCGWGKGVWGVESVCWFQGYCPRPFEAAGNSYGWVREEVRRVDGGSDTASADMKLCG